MSRKPCPDCAATYYIKTIGEDRRDYLVPLAPRYCPRCGRRLRGSKNG